MAAMLVLRAPYSLRPDIFFNSDFALAGLMANHIRAGEWWTFVWGQNSHGTFAAAVTAAVLRLTDWPLLDALQVPPLLFQAAHVAVAYGLVRDLLGRWAGLAYATLVLLPTRFFLFFTVRTSANYGEVLTLGLAALWVVLRVHRDEGPAGRRFFFWGFLTGFGMWCLMYTVEFLAVAVVFLLLRWRWLNPDRAWPEMVGWAHATYWSKRGVAWAAPGWALGYAPVLIHLVRGGRIDHQFGLVAPAQWAWHFWLALRGQPAHLVFPPPGWPAPLTAAGTAAYAIAVLALAWAGLRWWHAARRGEGRLDPLLLWLLLPVSWGLFVVSANTPLGAERYLWPYQAALPLAVLVLAAEVGRGVVTPFARRWGPVAVVAAFAALNASTAIVDFVQPACPCRAQVVELLRREGVRAGFADYWESYRFTLLLDEKIIIAPSGTLDRFPPYTRFARSEPRVAWIMTEQEAGASRRRFTLFGREYRQVGADHRFPPYVVKLTDAALGVTP